MRPLSGNIVVTWNI